jgi:hypothetical protein
MYPSDASYPEAMCETPATKTPPVPRRIRAIGAQELLQQLIRAVTCYRWQLRAEGGDSPAWEHILNRWRRFEFLASR